MNRWLLIGAAQCAPALLAISMIEAGLLRVGEWPATLAGVLAIGFALAGLFCFFRALADAVRDGLSER